MHGVDRSLNPRLTDVFDIIFFFAHKTTIMVVTKVPVHELDKKANELAFTVAHQHNRPLQIIKKSYNFIHTTSKFNQSIKQSINHLY